MLPNALSSKTITPKTSFYLIALTLLLTFLPLTHVSYKLKLHTKDLRDFHQFDQEKSSNEKDGKQLILSEGEWYFIPKTGNLEFHSDNRGMFYFDTFGHQKVIHLDAPTRVLIFPRTEHNGQTYVAKSQVSKSPKNHIKIFPRQPGDRGNHEKLEQAFNYYLEYILSPDQLAQGISGWNNLPYYFIKLDKDSYWTWDNHYYMLHDFDEKFWGNLKLSEEQQADFSKLFGSSESYIRHINKILTRFAKFLYFGGDENMLYSHGVDMKSIIKSIYVDETINNRLYEFIDKDNSKLLEKINKWMLKFYQILFEITKQAIEHHILEKEDDYINEFFENNKDLSFKEHIQNRYQQRATIPLSRDMMRKNMKMVRDINIKFKGTQQEKFTDQFNKMKELLQGMVNDSFLILGNAVSEFIYPLTEEHYENVTFNDDMALLLPVYDRMEQSEFGRKFNVNDKKKYQQTLKKADWDRIIVDEMMTSMIGTVLNAMETNLYNWVVKWDLLPKMKMNLEADDQAETFEWFKRLIMIFGVIDYVPEVDDPRMEFKSISIFDLSS
jgi:hypothetical protein